MQNNLPKLNNALWRIRRRNGLEPKQVASLLGHNSPDLVSGYERGDRSPSLSTALKLSVIYKCSIELMFPEQLESYRESVGPKLTRIPHSFVQGASHDRKAEAIDRCTYERHLENADSDMSDRGRVRDHITSLAKRLAGL